VLRSIADAVMTTDKDGAITFMNSAAEVLTGWREKEAVGRPLGEVFHLVHDGRGGTNENPVTKIAYGGGSVGFGNERILISRDEKEMRIDHSAAPLRDESGRIKGVILTFHDITERKIMEKQLVQAQKLEAIGQLAEGITHEINTPTQSIGDNTRFFKDAFDNICRLLGKYEQLLKAAKSGAAPGGLIKEVEETAREINLAYLTEEVPKGIQRTLEGIERVTKILRAMKEFSHPRSLEKTSININKAIETTITVARNEWQYVAEMITDLDPNLPMVPCLPGEFNQVILNVIINAVHAIADVVGDGSVGKGTIKVSTHRNNDWAEIRISDTGTGIPKEFQPRVFDSFFTTKKGGKGTGQGLTIAHSVIAGKHGGAISFDTEVGKGTTFIIRLPVGDKAEAP
jgi:PAS domain S-box-containing protein